jgi:hypothetical protein
MTCIELCLKTEAISSCKISVDFQLTTRRYIPDNQTLHNSRCKNLSSYRLINTPCCSKFLEKTVSCWDGQEILKLLRNPKVYYYLHKSLAIQSTPLCPIYLRSPLHRHPTLIYFCEFSRKTMFIYLSPSSMLRKCYASYQQDARFFYSCPVFASRISDL